jgi:hypothetical protein
MERTPRLFALIAAMLVSPVFAQESQHCYNGNGEHITICEFQPSGRVNVTETFDNSQYFSRWYTHAEWLRYKSNPKHTDVYQKPINTKREADAQEWASRSDCEASGFAWRIAQGETYPSCHVKVAK